MKVSRLILLLLLFPAIARANDGVISYRSVDDVKTTADRLESLLEKQGMTIFMRLSHSDGARKVGIDLRPTELVVFGNPKVGSPLMQCRQVAAIDLPQKALIWQDAAGTTFISYNDPAYIRERHRIEGCEKVLEKISSALANFARGAAGTK